MPLEQQPLHLLQLLLMLFGERFEEGGDSPAAASTTSATGPCTTAAAIAAPAASHAATVVAGKGATGRFNGQQASRCLAEAALPPVPRLFPRGDGGKA